MEYRVTYERDGKTIVCAYDDENEDYFVELEEGEINTVPISLNFDQLQIYQQREVIASWKNKYLIEEDEEAVDPVLPRVLRDRFPRQNTPALTTEQIQTILNRPLNTTINYQMARPTTDPYMLWRTLPATWVTDEVEITFEGDEDGEDINEQGEVAT